MNTDQLLTLGPGDKYTLLYPVELMGANGKPIETIRELTLRRLRGVDLAAVTNAHAKGPGDALKEMVCRACAIPPSTFDQLDAEDLTRLGAVASGFFGLAPSTGGT